MTWCNVHRLFLLTRYSSDKPHVSTFCMLHQTWLGKHIFTQSNYISIIHFILEFLNQLCATLLAKLLYAYIPHNILLYVNLASCSVKWLYSATPTERKLRKKSSIVVWPKHSILLLRLQMDSLTWQSHNPLYMDILYDNSPLFVYSHIVF